ncbi:hypothetical protein PMAC_001444 [Pneumocystis sp. 'macacae']|nr:hypothetical protein PMAC_001444 [Pneumocystis sp. 'macacae']
MVQNRGVPWKIQGWACRGKVEAEDAEGSVDWEESAPGSTEGSTPEDTEDMGDTDDGDSGIVAGYGSESSTEETRNTIGNVQRLILSLKQWIEKDGSQWEGLDGSDGSRTGVISKETGEEVRLTAEELDLVRKIQQMQVPEDGFDPYEVLGGICFSEAS